MSREEATKVDGRTRVAMAGVFVELALGKLNIHLRNYLVKSVGPAREDFAGIAAAK